jgi:hypothetical protein
MAVKLPVDFWVGVGLNYSKINETCVIPGVLRGISIGIKNRKQGRRRHGDGAYPY